MALLTVGVDVGGTNTDAVIINQSAVICSAKTPTTEDITSGLETAIRNAIQNLPLDFTSSSIHRVNIGTTHFVNAVVQRKDIVPVAVLRLCGPASRSVAPFTDFPDDLKRVIAGPYYFLNGGYEFDGNTVLSEVDEEEVKSVVRQIQESGIRNIAVTGVFSSVNKTQEELVQKIIHQVNPDINVTLSHKVGLIGFLERENASILNESLKPLCLRTVAAFEDALQRVGLSCPFYLTQNDGTIISAERAKKFPVFTFASGPTNSMRGAAHLSNVKDAIVVDIGGTTTDVGVLCKGFPRQSSTRVKVGGVITNFRMPDVLSIGLGGGSLVSQHPQMGNVTVGPESVGYRLETEALVFGGNVMTATDIAVSSSLCNIGNKQSRVDNLQEDLKNKALNTIKTMIEVAIDQVKICKEEQPVILVGGGSVLVDPDWKLSGASDFIKPDHFQSANAVGAALGKVSGVLDQVFSLEGKTEEQVMSKAVDAAYLEAKKNGAQPGTIEIIDKMAVKLAYLPGNVTRIEVKVVGDLADTAVSANVLHQPVTAPHHSPPINTNTSPEGNQSSSVHDQSAATSEQPASSRTNYKPTDAEKKPCIDQETGKPNIDSDTGEWILNEFDIDCMAIGAGILGCGGGGSPYIGRLMTQELIRSGKRIRVMHPDSLNKGDSVVVVGFMGAPVITVEKLPSGLETSDAAKALTAFLPKKSNSDSQTFAAVFCGEIGGMNSLEPIVVAAELGIPVVDADGMGRAFPELQMFLPYIYGCAPYPAGIADEKGNTLAMAKVTSSLELEKYFRIICVNMGCSAGIAFTISEEDVHQRTVKYSLSRIWKLGNAVLQARHNKTSPIDAILEHEGGKLLFTGKISDVERRTEHGFAKGIIIVESTTQEKQRPLKVEFQNENYLAYFVKDDGSKDIKACVPDLISLVDSETGEPLPTEEVRYGLRVAVLAMACPPLLATPKALKVVGPGAFGFKDIEYVPIGEYVEHDPIPRPKQR